MLQACIWKYLFTCLIGLNMRIVALERIFFAFHKSLRRHYEGLATITWYEFNWLATNQITQVGESFDDLKLFVMVCWAAGGLQLRTLCCWDRWVVACWSVHVQRCLDWRKLDHFCWTILQCVASEVNHLHRQDLSSHPIFWEELCSQTSSSDAPVERVSFYVHPVGAQIGQRISPKSREPGHHINLSYTHNTHNTHNTHSI